MYKFVINLSKINFLVDQKVIILQKNIA